MAFRAAQVTVMDNAGTKVVDAQAGDLEAWISVPMAPGGASGAIVVGGDFAVTVNDGFRLENQDNVLNLRVRPGDQLWAIAPAGTSTRAHVLIRSA